MAESELETRLNKKNMALQQQVNNLLGQLRNVQTQLTHPAAISTLKKRMDLLERTLVTSGGNANAFAVAMSIALGGKR